MTERVFVYGILLREQEFGWPASLHGYRLDFANGLATIAPDEDEYVAGALLEIDADTLRRYDSIEGVDRGDASSTYGHYRRVRVAVDTPHEHYPDAWVYIRNGEGDHYPPGTGMLAMIHEGYERWRLDVDKLEAAVERTRKEEAWTP